MLGSNGKIVVGYRWHSNRGRDACAQCAALDGQEFYLSPEPGQRSVAEMPERPLHPNCRCTVEDILDYAKVMGGQDEWGDDHAQEPASDTPTQTRKPFTSDEVSPRLHQGAKQAFGVNWCNDGRKVWDGPAYGNWGGQNWGGGRNTTNLSQEERLELIRQRERVPGEGPIDAMDKVFYHHDRCYTLAEADGNSEEQKIACDTKLVEGLSQLSSDPNDKGWENKRPKTEPEKEYARRFRAYATWYFEGRVNWHSVEQREDETRVE